MKLKDLIRDLPELTAVRGDTGIEICQITNNSREKTDRGLFFCIVGARFDAHSYAPQAVAGGCVALVVERFLDDIDVPQVCVTNGRAAMARIAAAFYGHPAQSMRLVGLTGTKGKTTTSFLLKSIIEQAGLRCGLIGTTGNMIGERHMKSNLTTPDPIDLHRTLREMADAGVQVVVMEVSAHAIDMHRLEGLTFEVGTYTNLSQDHLDYFGTMDRYFETKKRFIAGGMVRNATVNVDDERAAQLKADIRTPFLTYGICLNADLFARGIELDVNGVSFEMKLNDGPAVEVHLKLTGTFNVYNALAAASAAMVLGLSAEEIRRGLEAVQSVPGRVEVLQTGTPYRVMLDYSHSPDALENILRTAREFTHAPGRVIVLFGCGGDRDRGKRPMMGEIGGRMADYCILTSDNPRTEDPMDILAAVEEGARRTGKPYRVIENRREAIRAALEMGREGDTIILAGKGHEAYQDIMGVKQPFDEKVVVAELLEELKH